MKHYSKIIFVFLVLILFFTISIKTKASGISVSPSKLEINNQNTQKIITVANPSADVMLFEVTADDFAESVNILPQSFTLESGARKEITVTIIPNKLKNQNSILATNISVLAKPLAENRLAIATGVKIPLTISLERQQKNTNIFWYFIIVFGIMSLLIYLFLHL